MDFEKHTWNGFSFLYNNNECHVSHELHAPILTWYVGERVETKNGNLGIIIGFEVAKDAEGKIMGVGAKLKGQAHYCSTARLYLTKVIGFGR